jgi:hypothetical protein
MIASVLVSKRRRDCLHQTPIGAQPPRSGGAGLQARGLRNDSVPSYRPIQRVDSWIRRSRSVVGGLGGGAEQSPLILRDPDVKAERERVSNPSDTLPGLLTMEPECAQRRMGLPKGEILDGLARRARVGRRAHPLPSSNVASQFCGRDLLPRVFPYLTRAEQVERTPLDRRSSMTVERFESAGTARLLSSLNRHESLQFEGLAPQQHVIDGPAQLGGQNAKSLSLAVLFLKPSEVLLPNRVGAQEQGSCFGEGPLEVDITHLPAGQFLRLAGRFVGSLHQASIGEKILDSGEAAEVVNLVEQGQREDFSNSRNRTEKIELSVAVLADLVNQVELHVPDDLVVAVEQFNVSGNGHLDCNVVEVLDDGTSIRCLVGPLFQGRQVVLGVGVLDVGQQFAALPGEKQAPAQQVASGAHLARVDISQRQIATPQQRCDLVGVEPVVLHLAPVDRLHVEGMAEDELDVLLAAQVGDPVPAEQALDSDHQILPVRSQGLGQQLSITGQFLVDQGFPLLVQDAEIEAASVEVDTAVMNMLSGVESHRGLLSWSSQPIAYRGGRGGGLESVSPPIERTDTALSCVAAAHRTQRWQRRHNA